MSQIMKLDSMVEFIRNETPENEELLLSAYKSVHCLFDKEQECIDHRIPELVMERDYDKVNEYVKMSKIVSELSLELSEWANKCGIKRDKSTIDYDNKDSNEITELPEDELESIFSDGKRINYENFRVDENIAYDLMTDFRYMKPAAFSLDGVRYPARLWKLVLLKTCELLWEKNHSIFENFVNDKFMQGKTRVYFSEGKDIMVKPELIKGTQIYVETNLSANSIRDMIVKMLDKYRIPHASYQIYLSKDLNPLHVDENKPQDIETALLQDYETIDMQNICVDYDYKTEKCMNESSPYFIMDCCKRKNCSYITNEKFAMDIGEYEPRKIHVLPKKVLKKKICPQCGNNIERTIFSVEFVDGQDLKQQNLNGCYCQNCSKLYITEGTYNSFIANKKLENINVTFVKGEHE